MGITIPGSSPPLTAGYSYWKDGTDEYRMGVRSGTLYTDRLLPGGTWAQAEGVGWEVVGTVS